MARASGLSPDAHTLSEAVVARLTDEPVVIALSGGADSAALAWAVARDRLTRAISIDHGLAASGRLVAAAASVARHLGIDLDIVEVEATSESETALREVRLAALEAALAPGEVIATGHTRDDLAETVLGNVLRGTGTAGLSGIPAFRPPFIRPLLDVPRSLTRAVAIELGLPFVDDPSNRDLDIRRNRIRHETIPALAAEFNPRLPEALYRLGLLAAADDAILDRRAGRVQLRVDSDAVLVPAAPLVTLPVAVAARVARRALRRVRGTHAGTMDEINAVLEAAQGRRVTIGGGIDVTREGPWVVLVTGDASVPDRQPLLVGTSVAFGSWELGAEAGRWSLGRFSATVPDGSSLAVRAAEPGDTIAISTGTKEVGVALAEAGVAPRQRNLWPVVESGGTIVWIPGVRAAPMAASQTPVRVWARRIP